MSRLIRRSVGRLSIFSTVSIFCAYASTALASNGSKARIPVRWIDPTSCVTQIDRATQRTLHIEYTFDGADDVRPTDATDELADSRTHQFFALCHGLSRAQALPNWITRNDVERSMQLGLVPDPVQTNDVLDENALWNECAIRINPDNERRPIARAHANQGVDWDLDQVASGTYLVAGYTFEPPTNRWADALRPGVITIYDSTREASPPPALALTSGSQITYRDRPFQLQACIAADPGASLEFSWSPVVLGQDPTWIAFLSGSTPANGTFAFEFTVPPGAAQTPTTALMIRGIVRDAQGRSYEAYSRHDLVVLNSDAPPDSTPETPNDSGAQAEQSGCSMGPKAGHASAALLLAAFAAGALSRNRNRDRRNRSISLRPRRSS
jgi:hypothetical protein